jgi:O-antigen/teichoic acid export membrane protein
MSSADRSGPDVLVEPADEKARAPQPAGERAARSWASLSAARLRVRAASVRHDRLVRTAWPLIVTTGLNAVLGVVYWVVAARLYDQATVAKNMAVIAAMTTLSGISQLNLGPSLGVLVPRAGEHGRRVVLQVYVAVTTYALVAITVFVVLVLPHLTRLSQVLGSTSRILLFASAVLLFNIFALQDAALAALRWARVIPLENGLFGAAKIVLLFVLVGSLPRFGIFTSWFVPMLVIVPIVSSYIFLRRSDRDRSTLAPTTPRDSVPKLALDYVGYLFQVSSTFFLPVVALELLEPEAASVFAIAWLTSSTLDMVATNVGTALTIETSYGVDPEALRRTIFRRAMPLVALVTAVGVLLAPLILALYGPAYSADGAHTLQILLLASVPRCLVTFAIAESRAHRNMKAIVWLRAQNAALALGLSAVLAPRFGVEGMALAWLVAQLFGGVAAIRLVWRRPAPSLEVLT